MDNDCLYDSICLTSVAPTILDFFGLKSEKMASSNPVLEALKKEKLSGGKIDRIVIYNPDAVGLWLYQKYTALFTDAIISSDISLPLLSVMPSVTPVCFASMYTGIMPEKHGIRKYEKPVLKCNTVFDDLIKAGKKCAIVSTAGDSISKIFLEREMDYYIFDSVGEVNSKALELISEDKYDFIVIYNGNYDSNMHKVGPEGENAMNALKSNIAFYKQLTDKIKNEWKNHNTFFGFCPDHGCHEIDGECGSHGLDMEEDMNIIHFYGISS